MIADQTQAQRRERENWEDESVVAGRMKVPTECKRRGREIM